jgi:hypothetical protein
LILKDIGIEPHLSARAQRFAAVPEAKFERIAAHRVENLSRDKFFA